MGEGGIWVGSVAPASDLRQGAPSQCQARGRRIAHAQERFLRYERNFWRTARPAGRLAAAGEHVCEPCREQVRFALLHSMFKYGVLFAAVLPPVTHESDPHIQPHRCIRAPAPRYLNYPIWIQLRLSLSVLALLAVCISVMREHACRRYAILRQSELVTLRRKNDLSTAKSWRLSSSSRVDPPGKKTFNRVKAGAEKSLWAAISNQATETYLVRPFLIDCCLARLGA